MKKFIVAVFFIFLSLAGVNELVKAAPLADPNDIFYVDLPAPNRSISGSSQIRFKIYDDNYQRPPYEIALYNKDCKTKFGTIDANNYVIKNSSNIYTKTWNTNGPIKDKATVPNGTYCLKVCVTLENEGNKYAVCDLRHVTLTDPVAANRNPVITSTPPNTLLIAGQRFGYDVNATDPDNNTLTYKLSSAPAFLKINSSTGEISTVDTLTETGSFSVVVKVEDGKGGSATQQFTITVVEEPSTSIGEITILSPAKDAILTGADNLVKWQIKNITDISKITIYYSKSGEAWKEIAQLGADATEYKWDVSNIESEDYLIRIVVTAKDGKTYEGVSEKFQISSKGGGTIEPAASIVDLKPEEDSKIDELKEISATLVPAPGETVKKESVKVLLDDKDIMSKCEVIEKQVKCTINEETAAGKHKIFMEFEDSKGNKASKQWFFEINEGASGQGQGGDEEVEGLATWAIIALICLIAALLILIPWVLYSIWRRRDRNDDEQTQVEEYTQNDYVVPSDTNLTTNYYEAPAENIAQDTTMYTEPETNYDEYAISEGSLGSDDSTNVITPDPVSTPAQVVIQEPENVTVEPAVTTPVETPAEVSAPTPTPTPVQTPTIQETNVTIEKPEEVKVSDEFTMDDIPDWLKDTDSSSSKPVSPSGNLPQQPPAQPADDNMSGAEPYSDYGLAPQDMDNDKPA